MKKLEPTLTTGKNTRNITSRRGKTGFGTNILGFGSGGTPFVEVTAKYLIIGGGGSGMCSNTHPGGGGGAGGYRTSFASETPGGPAGSTESAIVFAKAGDYTITIGAGGSAVQGPGGPASGNNTVLNHGDSCSVTAFAGGGQSPNPGCGTRGSMGAGGFNASAVSGTPTQGFPSGAGTTLTSPTFSVASGGGGGAGSSGSNGTNNSGGAGGSGKASSITGSPVTRAGGGGGTSRASNGSGGPGGGGSGSRSNNDAAGGPAGDANTGSGGGGNNNEGSSSTTTFAGNGGSGVVFIRFPACACVSVSPGTNTVATVSCEQLATFTVTGTVTLA